MSERSHAELLVLDTNTVLALWMFRDPALESLRLALERGEAAPLCRDDALEELRRVLGYRQFGQSPQAQEELLEFYRRRCRMLLESPEPGELPACRDRDDQKFLEIAVGGGARCLLTRDKALLRVGRHRRLRECLDVLTPEQWQRRRAAGSPTG